MTPEESASEIARLTAELERARDAHVPLELRCPQCDMIRVDQDEFATTPHRTHLCHGCGNVWQPYTVTTVGVDVHASCRKHIAALEIDDITNRRRTHLLKGASTQINKLVALGDEAERIIDRDEALLDKYLTEIKKFTAEKIADLERIQQLEHDLAWTRGEWHTAGEENEALRKQRDELADLYDGLIKRRDELLEMVAKLSQTVPLESEVAEALNQRGALVAEVGTLRARIKDLETELANREGPYA